MLILQYLTPNWTAPSNIRAYTTTRHGGISQGLYASNNLALHVNDNPHHVEHNRHLLIDNMLLPQAPEWLEQTHSTQCIQVDTNKSRQGDAAYTRTSGCVLTIMTADCLPILLCNSQGTEIAAVHAGWRGLVNGVIENTLAYFIDNPANLMAWIGPAICGNCYEVGDEVRAQAIKNDILGYTLASFKKSPHFSNQQPKWLANLPHLAELRLKQAGVVNVFQSEQCTYELSDRYYSYRKQAQTGRIATLLWIDTHSKIS